MSHNTAFTDLLAENAALKELAQRIVNNPPYSEANWEDTLYCFYCLKDWERGEDGGDVEAHEKDCPVRLFKKLLTAHPK